MLNCLKFMITQSHRSLQTKTKLQNLDTSSFQMTYTKVWQPVCWSSYKSKKLKPLGLESGLMAITEDFNYLYSINHHLNKLQAHFIQLVLHPPLPLILLVSPSPPYNSQEDTVLPVFKYI